MMAVMDPISVFKVYVGMSILPKALNVILDRDRAHQSRSRLGLSPLRILLPHHHFAPIQLLRHPVR